MRCTSNIPAMPRFNLSQQHTHIALALFCTLAIAFVWLAPLPGPAFIKPFIVAIIACLPFAGLIAFRYIFFICLLFIGFAFFRFHEAFPVLQSLRIPLLLSLAILGVLVYDMLLSRRIKAYWEPEFTPFAIFVIWGICGIFFATNKPLALDYFVDIFSKIAIMTFAIAWIITKPQQMMTATKFIVISGILIGCVALYNKMMGIGLVEGTRVTISRELGSSLGDPNDLSLRLLFPLSFAAALVTVPKSKMLKVFGLIGVVLIIGAIIATQSRGGLLGLLAVMGVFAHRYIKSKALLVTLVIIAALVLASAAGLSGRISGGAHEAGIDASAQGRLDAWKTALSMTLHNPIFGVGFDNFYANYFFYTSAWDGKPHAVHSTWFDVMSQTGIVGFMLFMTMFSIMVVRTLKHDKMLNHRQAPEAIRCASLAIMAGIAGFAVAGTFLTQGFDWPVYILLALTAAISRYSRVFKQQTQEAADNGFYDNSDMRKTGKTNMDHVWNGEQSTVKDVLWNPLDDNNSLRGKTS